MTKPQKNISLSLGMFSIVFLLAILLFIIPSIKGMAESSEAFLTEQKRIAVLEQKVNNLEEIEMMSAKIEEGMKKHIDSFINEKDPIEFITFLEKMAFMEGSEISINPLSVSKEEENASAFTPLSFQVSILGTYDGFARFLEKIESSKWIMKIDEFNITKTDSKEGNYVTARLNLKVYRLK